MNDIIEGNKKIADFLQIEITGKKDKVFKYFFNEQQWALERLKFHSSWDWIMIPVEKIAKEHTSFTMYFGNIGIQARFEPKNVIEDEAISKVVDLEKKNPIIAVWLAVITFIDYYNTIKKEGEK